MAKIKIPSNNKIIFLAVIILLASGIAWCNNYRSNPKVVFNRMLLNSMSSSSVTKNVTQDQTGQKLNQTDQITNSPKAQVHQINIIDQAGQATITTETIANQQTDYVRYTEIKTSQKNKDGKEFDFSDIIGKWGKSGAESEISEGAQTFGQSIYGIVPIARLSTDSRRELISIINSNKVYDVDYSKVFKTTINNRPTYTYEVKVNPKAYIDMLKLFSNKLGSNKLDNVDSSRYKSAEPVAFTFVVDVWTGQLRNVKYVESGRVENYSAYGALSLVPEPQKYISIEELQNKLQKIE